MEDQNCVYILGMHLADLEALALAVRLGSLSAAARRLFLTQPAVSARLKRLEREVGEPLLVRSGSGMRPTAAGAHLATRAEQLLLEVRRLEEESRPHAPLAGRLVLGATDLVAVQHLPPLLRRFRRRHPACELAVRVEGTEPLVRLLLGGEIELALGTLPSGEATVEETPLFQDQLVLVAPPGHPRAGGRPVRPEALAGETWISHKPESVTRRLVEGFFAGHGVSLRVAMEISSPEAIRRLVQARLGIAPLPWSLVHREVKDGRLALIPVRGFRLTRASGLLLRRGTPLGRIARAFCEPLRSSGQAGAAGNPSPAGKGGNASPAGKAGEAGARGPGEPPAGRSG